jgi:hypothetical protein
MNVW